MGIDWEEILGCEGADIQSAYDNMVPDCDSYDDMVPVWDDFDDSEYEDMDMVEDEKEMMILSELVDRLEEPWLTEEIVKQVLKEACMLTEVVISIDHDKIKQL